jgi:fatty acid desaturase
MLRPSTLGTLVLLGHALGFFVLPAWAARNVYDLSWPLAAKLPLIAVLIALAGHGLHLLGIVGHEGIHFTLHRNKVVSAMIGIVVASLLVGQFASGFAATHWNHHRFTNTQSDPDGQVFMRYRSLWARMLFARLHADHIYFGTTIRIALDRPLALAYRFPLPPRTFRRCAWFNLAAAASFFALYVAITWVDPVTGVISIGLPLISAALFSGLRPYVEHANTEPGMFRDTRSRTSWLSTWFFLGTNYHLEHHLYPSVPCYRLPRVHRFLVGEGVLAGAPIETTLGGGWRHATSGSQYPREIISDSPIDPIITQPGATQPGAEGPTL